MAREGMEDLHRVVEQEPEPLHGDAGARASERVGDRDCVAPFVHRRDVRGVRPFHHVHSRDLDVPTPVDDTPPAAGMLLRDQGFDRHVHVVGIGQVRGSVGEPGSLGLGHHMTVLGRSETEPSKVVALQDVEGLDDLDAAARRWAAAHGVTSVARRDGWPDAQAIASEVLFGNQTAVAGEVVGDEASELASIERAGAFPRYHPQRLGVVRHLEQLACQNRLAAGSEDLSGGGRRLEDVQCRSVARRRIPEPLLLLLAGKGEPVLREIDGGRDQLGPGERSEPGGHLVEGHQRARYGDRKVAHLVDEAL